MRFEKVEVFSDVFKLGPAFCLYGGGIQIVDERIGYGQQNGGVGRQDKLTAKVPRRLRDIFAKVLLAGDRKAVLGLVQKV